MKIIKLVQGTPAWHEHRAKHFNASDAPAMLGLSKYKTRSQLMYKMHTGMVPEVDAGTQQRFNDGHRFEALARPLAEDIIGEELSPVVGSEGKLSASFDGITFGNGVIFEHKTLNDKIRDALASNVIPSEHCAQMEQQLMISGATKCLFMASKFDGNDVLIEELHCWYESDQVMRDNIMQGWTQFAIDLEIYVPPEVVAPAVAAPIMQLPAVVLNATGALSASNLGEITPRFDAFLAGVNTTLTTDEDFVNGDATAKFSRTTADALKMKAKEVIGQIASVSEAVNTLTLYAEKFDALGLKLEKLVKSEKDNRKTQMVCAAGIDFSAHIKSLEAETRPLQLIVKRPDFAEAIKGMKRLDKMQEAVDNALRNAKYEADVVAKDVRAKLAWCKEHVAGMSYLFPDLAQIITKPLDDFTLLIASRIKDHKEAEAKKVEEQTARIREEERVKAEATAKANAEEGQRLAAKAQAEIEQEAADKAEQEATLAASQRESDASRSAGRTAAYRQLPTRAQLIQAVSEKFAITTQSAEEVLRAAFSER